MLRRCAGVWVLLALCWPAPRIWACYAVIVGRDASADGSVLVGHNEQNGGLRILNFRRIPRRQFPEDATVELFRGGVLPQVPETWTFLWSENPGLEFSDAYLNEWGVAVVSDACPTREDGYETLVARGEIRDGGIGYMLRRLVAERARTAREGVELAGKLVERFGYVHSGRTYVIADPREAWLVAVVRGRRWVAQRVPDDRVVLLPNVHILGEVDLTDTDNYLSSPDLVDYAVKRGWAARRSSGAFDFRRAYCGRTGVPADPRRLRGRQLALGSRTLEPSGKPLSFGVRPAEKMTVAAVAAILRDKGSPRPISSPVTQEGAVLQLRAGMPKEIGCVYWRTTAEPATSVLTPWYLGIRETPPSYFRSVDVEQHVSLDHHFRPPQGTFDPDPKSAWWTFRGLQDWVYEDYKTRIPIVRRTWTALEQRTFASQSSVESKAIDLWKADHDAARAYLTQHCAEVAAEACGQAERLFQGSGGGSR